MLGITDYLWRLLPGNPILLRVVGAAGKRRRDWFVRMGYLGLLVGLVIFSIADAGSGATGGLDELAKMSARIFRNMSYLQLAAVALLAPIFTAGAITQEKDSQTYDILLATPLTNGQIILGSLGSRLFFVLALLISGIPIFSITQIFGGVAIHSIVMSFLIAVATAVVTGALAMAIATFKVGTRRTIFSFYLFIVIYLVGGLLLDRVPFFQIDGRRINPNVPSHISWFTGIHPFLALRVIFNHPEYAPPSRLDLPPGLQFWPIGWYLSNPSGFYVTFMFLLSAVLIAPSVVFLRRLAQSTSTLKGWFLQKIHLSTGDKTRKPRGVWNNPIAWREAKTKASAARASVLRYGFIAAGVVGAIVLVVMYATERPYNRFITSQSYDPANAQLSILKGDQDVTIYRVTPRTVVTLNGNQVRLDDLTGKYEVAQDPNTTPSQRGAPTLTNLALRDIPRRLDAATVRNWLLGAVIIEFAVILLIVTNAAASTVTREKEDGSLDLLLTTPITSRYYVWGKLRGLVSFVMPLVAVPVVSAMIFVFHDFGRMLTATRATSFEWIVFPEAVLVMPGTLIIVAAFAGILGMNLSLRCRTTVRAVMSSVGIVVGICGMLGFCGWQILEGSRATPISLVFSSFSPFTVLTVLINPYTAASRVFAEGSISDIINGRVITFIFAWVATGAYALVVWSMYKAMVKNFDMTIRRQSR
ncbi:MAG: ABC transporter permease [Tepidisphaeraceae bacterium]